MIKPHASPGMTCPFHGKDVSKVCHACPLFVLVRGKHPSTGADLDEWGCSFGLLPMLLIENAKQSRAGACATESLREEIIKTQSHRSEVIRSFASRLSDTIESTPHERLQLANCLQEN